MTRLLRLAKLRQIAEHINDYIDSEYTSIFLNLLKMVNLLLVANHVVCCLWYAIGNANINDERNWIAKHIVEGDSWHYRYATAFHWSLTQFTPASMEVQPYNAWERFFANFVIVIGLVTFSYIVGSITGSLTQLRQLSQERRVQFWALRRYMKQKKVDKALSSRIGSFLDYAWQSKRENLRSEDVQLLLMLSEGLHSELEWQLFSGYLEVHPLFHHLAIKSRLTMHRLATRSLSNKHMAENDCLFVAKEKATHVFLLVDGELEYHKQNLNGSQTMDFVQPKEDWISEAVLWASSWVHMGGVTAKSKADLISVEPDTFGDVVSLNPFAFKPAKAYALKYIAWLRAQEPSSLTDLARGSQRNISVLLTGTSSADLSDHLEPDFEPGLEPQSQRTSETIIE